MPDLALALWGHLIRDPVQVIFLFVHQTVQLTVVFSSAAEVWRVESPCDF